ncbi:MAG TPA: DUF2946 family protein [Methylosinus sp.]|uniref:DUF2946 family protein n=1 Tax=Methylosinus sp. TaxID=427 RepID=UPI002F955172
MHSVLTRLLVGVILLAQAIAGNVSARMLGDELGAPACTRAAFVETKADSGHPADSDQSSGHHRHERCLQCPEIISGPPPLASLSAHFLSRVPLQERLRWRARALPLGRFHCDPNVFARAGPSVA